MIYRIEKHDEIMVFIHKSPSLSSLRLCVFWPAKC
jgi:hypothetical protein